MSEHGLSVSAYCVPYRVEIGIRLALQDKLLPKGKAMLNTTQESMKQELLTELSKGVTLDDIKDRSGEWVDGYLPVYNNRIIEKWQTMPSEYDNRGANELGAQQGHDIISLMSLDLYLYYSDLFNEVIEELESDNLCVICKTLSLDEYGCFNHKAMKECLDCCGCEL